MRKPLRPQFRFHLATILAQMLTAAALLWLNVVGAGIHTCNYAPLRPGYQSRFYGFPLICAHEYGRIGEQPSSYTYELELGINAVFCLAVIAAVGWLCERLIRRREKAVGLERPSR